MSTPTSRRSKRFSRTCLRWIEFCAAAIWWVTTIGRTRSARSSATAASRAFAGTHMQWLERLGTDLQIDGGGRRLRLRHASPWDEETYLYPDADEKFARLE